MAFKMIINHFAGMMLLIICKGSGMLSIGKIKPDKIKDKCIEINQFSLDQIILAKGY